MKIAYPISLEAARMVAERHKQLWEQAKTRKARALEGAVVDHSHLPDNYWQDEHRAHGLYKSAAMLVEMLSMDEE